MIEWFNIMTKRWQEGGGNFPTFALCSIVIVTVVTIEVAYRIRKGKSYFF